MRWVGGPCPGPCWLHPVSAWLPWPPVSFSLSMLTCNATISFSFTLRIQHHLSHVTDPRPFCRRVLALCRLQHKRDLCREGIEPIIRVRAGNLRLLGLARSVSFSATLTLGSAVAMTFLSLQPPFKPPSSCSRKHCSLLWKPLDWPTNSKAPGSFSIKAVTATTMFAPWRGHSRGATSLAPVSLLTPAIMVSGFRSLFTTSSLRQRIAATTFRKSKCTLGICASQIIFPGSWAETSITSLKKTRSGLTAPYSPLQCHAGILASNLALTHSRSREPAGTQHRTARSSAHPLASPTSSPEPPAVDWSRLPTCFSQDETESIWSGRLVRQRVPISILEQIANHFMLFEAGAPWPLALLLWRQTHLQKPPRPPRLTSPHQHCVYPLQGLGTHPLSTPVSVDL